MKTLKQKDKVSKVFRCACVHLTALLENGFCDSFPLKNLVSYKSHDSSEANNEAHALGINLDCMKLAFGNDAMHKDS